MDKQFIIDAFRDSIYENDSLCKSIYGDSSMLEDIEQTVLSISSLDFVDLLIDVESRLGFEFADECLSKGKTKIGELVEIIESMY
ncbi:MAG: hypothetical protein FWD05_00035 [Oscillospiraceae bacterium]|nr:hypothetical protein [Oscillospiraceae bacterium]